MKKLVLLICFLCLCGCSNTSVKKPCKIVLNINSEVIPEITSSTGKGKFNTEKMEYVLETDVSKPVDISLAHPDYETVNLYFSSGDLMDGYLEKDVVFGSPKTAKIKLNVLTTAAVWDISAEGLDFKRSLKSFTAIANRSEDINVTIKGGEEYRDVLLKITKEDLITGLFVKDVVLVKKDEVVIFFNNDLRGISVIDYDKGQKYRINQYDQGYYCIVRKDSGIIINNNDKINFYKANEDFKYNNEVLSADILIKYNLSTSAMNELSNPNMYLYYIKNNKLVHASLTYYSTQVSLPVGAPLLLIYPNDHGTLNVRYHYGYNLNSIRIAEEEFTYPKELTYNVRFYDRVAKQYLTEITIDDNVYTTDDNFYFVNMSTFPTLKNYYHESLSIGSLVYNDGSFIMDVMVTPKNVKYILNFVDQSNQPLKIDLMNGGYEELSVGRYLIYGLSDNINGTITFSDANRPFSIRVKVNNHWITINKSLYSEMFTELSMNGEKCYELTNPIMVDVNSYELKVGLVNTGYKDNYIIHNGKIYSSKTNIFQLNEIKVGDTISIVIPSNDDQKIEVKCTKSLLEKGYLFQDVINVDDDGTVLFTVKLSPKYKFMNHSYNVWYNVDTSFIGTFEIINDQTAIISAYLSFSSIGIPITILYSSEENDTILSYSLSLRFSQTVYTIE